MSPNKHMLRAGKHKVRGRGRLSLVTCSAPRARVLIDLRAGADVGRWAASQRHAGIEAKTIPFVSFLYFGGAYIE